jgi:uncharacterized protein (DUF58 family)
MLPTNRLIVLLAAASPLWFLAAVLPGAWVVPLVYLLVLLLLSFWGYSHIPGPRHFSIKRILPSRFSLGSEQSIVLSITNHSGQKILMEVRDDLPGSLKLLSRFEPFLLNPGSTVEVGCRVKPVKRGYLHLRHVHCRVQQQGFELVRRQFSVEVESQGKVYPRFLGVDKYDLLASIDRREEGLKTSRLGQGSDFESLRPYLPGEDLRSIDWKISAKRDALISRNLQVEKGLLIDAGRFMLDRIGDRSRFEHALDAAVMLSYVAQKKGDTVSVACFSNRIESFLPPVKGQLIMPRVLETLFDVHPRNIESDYWHVFARSAGLVNNLVHSVRKHLVLCVVLAEEKVYTAADQAPSNLRQSYLKAAAGHVILERYMALDDMRSKGIMVLETSPEHFSIQLVRKYLEIRKTDLL